MDEANIKKAHYPQFSELTAQQSINFSVKHSHGATSSPMPVVFLSNPENIFPDADAGRWEVRIAKYKCRSLNQDFPYINDFDQKIHPLGWLEVFEHGLKEPVQVLGTPQLSIEF